MFFSEDTCFPSHQKPHFHLTRSSIWLDSGRSVNNCAPLDTLETWLIIITINKVIFTLIILVVARIIIITCRFYAGDVWSARGDLRKRYEERVFCSSRMKMFSRGTMHYEELYHLVRLPERSKAINSSRRTTHLVPDSIRNELNRPTKYLPPTSSQMDNASHIARLSLHYTKKTTDV